jgi:hypothetical protein
MVAADDDGTGSLGVLLHLVRWLALLEQTAWEWPAG